MLRLLCASFLGLAALFHSGVQAGAELLHSERSRFGAVLVFEENGERCMNFNTMVDFGRQTCMDLADPEKLVFSYTRMMMSALYAKPAPASILIVGLGGASLQNTLARLLPEAVIDTVEIDPAVGKVAAAYFGYREGPRQRLHIEDGRAYIERAHRENRRYDMVMLDAFDVDYIPEHMMTVEFLEHVKAILTDDGVVVANTFTNSRLYERESATYAAVFGTFFNLRESNRVIVAARGPLPGRDVLAANAARWRGALGRIGVEPERALDRYGSTLVAVEGVDLLRD